MDLIWNIMDLNSCYQLKMLFLVQRGLVGGNTKLTVSVIKRTIAARTDGFML